MMATGTVGAGVRRKSLPGGATRPRATTPQRRGDRSDRSRRKRPDSTSSLPLDRVSMLVIEANEISTCLKKDYHFTRDSSGATDDDKTIRITNKKFGISCLWSLDKLKERLIKMRKLVYAGDVESAGYSGESVFYDPRDAWEKVSVAAPSFDVPTEPCTNGIDAIDRAMEQLEKRAITAGNQANGATSHSNSTGGHSNSAINHSNSTDNNTSIHSNNRTSKDRAGELPRQPVIRPRPSSAQGRVSSCNGHSTGPGPELPADSQFITVTTTGPAVNGDFGLPEKYLISSPREEAASHRTSSSSPRPARGTQSPRPRPATTSTSSHGYGLQTRPPTPAAPPRPSTTHAAIQTEPSPNPNVSMLTVCKEMLRLTARRTRQGEEESLADRILISCESIKVAVINILEGYSQARDQGQSGTAFTESDLVRITSVQLVTALELLVSQASLWVATYGATEEPTVRGVSDSISRAVRLLAEELLAFIQSCEGDRDSMAHESSARILSLLYDLARHCGELAMATDLCPSSLKDRYHDDELDGGDEAREEDITHILPSSDLKQAFLSGVDSLVDQTLEGATTAMEMCEGRAGLLTDDLGRGRESLTQVAEDIFKHIYITVATSKLLVYKCREVQGELDTEMQEDCLRPPDYYICYFRRCQGMMSHVGLLTDNLNLLVQTAEPLAHECDPATLKKLCRCSEIVQRSTARLVRAACTDGDHTDHDMTINLSLDTSVASSINGLSLDLQSLRSQDASVLSPDQSSQLGQAGDDVGAAAGAVAEVARRELDLVGGQDVKVRRMLPATPSNIRPIVRPKSARSVERRRLDHNLLTRDVDVGN